MKSVVNEADLRYLSELANVAVAIANEAPEKFRHPGHYAYVRRRRIEAVREIMTRHKIDWRVARRIFLTQQKADLEAAGVKKA